MRPLRTSRSLPARLVRRVTVLVAAFVLLVATPAGAAVGAYGIAPGTGTFAYLTTNNLASDTTNDQMFYLSTSGTTARTRLPFPLRVYDATFRRIAISSNGNVQFGIASPGGNPTSFHECIPTTTDFEAATAFVLWGIGLRYGGPGEGIFLRTQGTAPNRTFTISWQGEFQVSAEAPANAQVTFRENSRTITYTYGELTTQTLVSIGIQSRLQDSYTERYCNGHGRYPTNGTRLKLGYVAA